MERLTVGLNERSYDILIGSGCRELVSAAARDASATLLVRDSIVNRLFGGELERVLRPAGGFVFPAGENSKTPETAVGICREAARLRLDRRAAFVALGGGVTGDLTGFAAAIYMRGIDFIQLPTTLLAMVDSSVGGKTGADLPEGKNLIGAFHQPSKVLIDPDFLDTLPEREIRGGLAEVVKMAVLLDRDFFEFLEDAGSGLLDRRDRKLYVELIKRSCELKSAIVSRDEKENGCRALLNYGHTFGHAVEMLSDFSVSHGEAVSIGMAAAAAYAVNANFLSAGDAERQNRLLAKIGLPVRLSRRYSAGAMLEIMRRDKKNSGGGVNIVIPGAIGNGEKTAAPQERILSAIEAIYE